MCSSSESLRHLVSFLLGCPLGLTSPVCSKSLSVVWAALQEMLRFRVILRKESSIAMRCQTTLQRRSAEYADLHPGSADTVIAQVFRNLNLPRFTAACQALSQESPGPAVAYHESHYDLRQRCTDAIRNVRTELQSTVLWDGLTVVYGTNNYEIT